MTPSDLIKSTLCAVCIAGAILPANAESEDKHACAPQQVSVYFAPGQTELTRASKQLLDHAQTSLSKCGIDRVSILGVADAQGEDSLNERLRLERANAAEAFLTSDGAIHSNQIEVILTSSDINGDGQPELMARKADIHFIPNKTRRATT